MSAVDDDSNPRECSVCPSLVVRCAHWGRYVVRLYPPSRLDPRLKEWGVEGPGIVDPQRARREGAPKWSMYLPEAGRFSSRHPDEGHAKLDFEARAEAVRRYRVPDEEAE